MELVIEENEVNIGDIKVVPLKKFYVLEDGKLLHI